MLFGYDFCNQDITNSEHDQGNAKSIGTYLSVLQAFRFALVVTGASMVVLCEEL